MIAQWPWSSAWTEKPLHQSWCFFLTIIQPILLYFSFPLDIIDVVSLWMTSRPPLLALSDHTCWTADLLPIGHNGLKNEIKKLCKTKITKKKFTYLLKIHNSSPLETMMIFCTIFRFLTYCVVLVFFCSNILKNQLRSDFSQFRWWFQRERGTRHSLSPNSQNLLG